MASDSKVLWQGRRAADLVECRNWFCCNAEHEWTYAAATGRVLWKVTKWCFVSAIL